MRQSRTGLFMVRIDHLDPHTLIEHRGEVPTGLFNERWQQDSRSHFLQYGKKSPPRSKADADALDDMDASSTLEFDPIAVMAKGDRDRKTEPRGYRPFMYDNRIPMKQFDKSFLECPTILVSMGILNFEDSSYSLRICKEVQKHLRHIPESYDRNDWNTIFRKRGLQDDEDLQKRFIKSFKQNFPTLVEGRSICVVDCTSFSDPNGDKRLRRHSGRHPEIMKGVPNHPNFFDTQ